MGLDDRQQIKRKVLYILREHGGQWHQRDFDQIDSGNIDLGSYLRELVAEGFVYHDHSQQTYVLTDQGGRHLTALLEADTARP